MALINRDEQYLVEECLYAHKYMTVRIGDLEALISAIMPPLPGSVLKMVGRPVAKTPFDTSQTERWGLRRATCSEAEEALAKKWVVTRLTTLKTELGPLESEYVRLLYDKELPARTVIRKMGLQERQFYRIRKRVLQKAWVYLHSIRHLLELACL